MTSSLCVKYFESRQIPVVFEQAIVEKFFKEFIEDRFSWARLAGIAIGGHLGLYTEEALFQDIDRADFKSAWNEHVTIRNIRRHRGNVLQDWGFPRRTLLFWSE